MLVELKVDISIWLYVIFIKLFYRKKFFFLLLIFLLLDYIILYIDVLSCYGFVVILGFLWFVLFWDDDFVKY